MTLPQVSQNPSPTPEPQVATPDLSVAPAVPQVQENPSNEDIFEQQMSRTGKMLAPKPTPVAPIEVEAPPEPANLPAPEPATLAPIHWPKERQEMFNNLPDQARTDYMAVAKEQERGYNEKKMQLAEYRREVADAVARLAPDPTQIQQEPAKPEAPPEDPIDRIKWEAKAEIRAEIAEEKAKAQKLSVAQEIAQVRHKVSSDPIREEAQSVLQAGVNSQPDVVCSSDPQGRTYRKIEFDRLDSEPAYFKAKYMEARQVVLNHQQQQAQGQTPAPAQTQVRTQVAPVLEAAGQNGGVVVPSQEDAKRKTLLDGIRRGKADTNTLGNFLRATVKRPL